MRQERTDQLTCEQYQREEYYACEEAAPDSSYQFEPCP